MRREEEPVLLSLHPGHALLRVGHFSFDSSTYERNFSSSQSEPLEEFGADLREDALLRPAHLDRVEFHHSPPRLVVADHRRISLPLVHAKVKLGMCRECKLPLLALKPPGEEGHIWCVLVHGDRSQAFSVVERLGRMGAIRRDFHAHYALDDVPLIEGGSARIFAVIQGKGRSAASGLVAKVAKDNSKAGAADTTLLDEAAVLAAVQGHPYVLELHALFWMPPGAGTGPILTVERCSGGDLQQVVGSRGCFTEDRARSATVKLLAALEHLHAQGVVHRDVKPENILLATGGRQVLADFGVAAYTSDAKAMSRRCGSPGYAAPEVVMDMRYGCKVDCFGAGAALHFLLCGEGPFTGDNTLQVLRRTVTSEVTLADPRFESVSGECKDLLLQLLQKGVSRRPTATDALGHEWLAWEPRPPARPVLALPRVAPTAPGPPN